MKIQKPIHYGINLNLFLVLNMAAEDIGKSFVQEFVIGFGFLSGLWIYAGVNPETEIIKALSSVIKELSPDPMYSFMFWIIPIIITLAS